MGPALNPSALDAKRMPDDTDHVAVRVGEAVLAGHAEDARPYLEELVRLDARHVEQTGMGTGLLPVGQDLVNAGLDDDIAYREASRRLLNRNDLSPELRYRLEADVANDPLRLAKQRVRDARMDSVARVFNALVAPASYVMTTGIKGLFGVAKALVAVIVAEHMDDELPLQERQALAHWKEFLERHPDDPGAIKVARRVEKTQVRWNRTRRDRVMRAARRAIGDDRPDAALILADRALRYAPEDPDATRMLERANAEMQLRNANRARALEAAPQLDPTTAASRKLAVALLAEDGDITAAAAELLTADPEGIYEDEARFALAVTAADPTGAAGTEGAFWKSMGRLADEDSDESNMARHARAIVESPYQNPHRAFQKAQAIERHRQLRWLLFGSFAGGPRERDLWDPLEWLIDLPSMVQSVLQIPNRLLQYPLTLLAPPTKAERTQALYARRYLERNPGGEHAGKLGRWLESFEEDRGNFLGAYNLAQTLPSSSPHKLASLREKAARQAFRGAERETRYDLRNHYLQSVAREFSDTEAGREAGQQARREVEDASTQHIRLTRGFLEENPAIVGPEGLDMRPEFLDGEIGNGELDDEGVILVGGRVLEFNFVDPDFDEPRVRRQRVSSERLADLVAMLDETTRQNAMRDADAEVAPDPDRELFFERARLGLTEQPDLRPGARSNYTFEGLREKYGLVRSRESILPFDIVIQGSLTNLGLGAFPRLRRPKPTPDAFLYD